MTKEYSIGRFLCGRRGRWLSRVMVFVVATFVMLELVAEAAPPAASKTKDATSTEPSESGTDGKSRRHKRRLESFRRLVDRLKKRDDKDALNKVEAAAKAAGVSVEKDKPSTKRSPRFGRSSRRSSRQAAPGAARPGANTGRRTSSKPTGATPKTVKGVSLSQENGEATSLNGEAAPKSLNLDFEGVDIRSIIRYLSEQTGTNFIFDDTLRGTVNVIGPRECSPAEALTLLESLLEYQGFTIIDAGPFKRVITAKTAQGQPILTRFQGEKLDPALLAQDRLVTQLVRIENTDVETIKPIVAGLLSRPNALMSYKPNNTLVITENAKNIERILRVIEALDGKMQGKMLYVEPLHHTLAAEIATELEKILKHKSEEKIEPETRQAEIARPVVLPNVRANSLIVVCMERDIAWVRVLIRRFDKETRIARLIRNVPVANADATELVGVLKELLQIGGEGASKDLVVVAQKRTNSILVSSISEALSRAGRRSSRLSPCFCRGRAYG